MHAAGSAAPDQRRLAVFDLDGTITYRDTLWPYVQGFLANSCRSRLRQLRVLPALIAFLLGRASHGDVKVAFIRSTLGGARRSDLQDWTTRFVEQVVMRGCFPQALAAVAEHRARGDVLILMSASTDLYVPAIGRQLGFTDSVCTGVRWDGERLDGALTTPNRRGEEKVRCFEALKARYPGLPTVAYGNAASDLPHLRLADQADLVNAGGSARRAARQLGIGTGRW